MRIIHTADWHLCERHGRVDRTKDLELRVEEVARLCETNHADVLLIAGDLFSQDASFDQTTAALEHLHGMFADFFGRFGTIIAVTGNHDREARIELVRQGMRLATPEAGRVFRPGRMYLLNKPFVGTLETVAGEKANFILVPYPTTGRFGLPADQFRTKDEEHRALNDRVRDWLSKADRTIDLSVPSVLVGHLHVAGGALSHTLHRITEQDDVVFDPGFRPNWVQYVALGHIHKQQALPGLPGVWYSGSLDRLGFDERNDEKGVVLVELGPAGLVRDPVPLAVVATPMHKLVIADAEAELVGLAERVSNPEMALMHVTVNHKPGGPTRDEITRAIRGAFPRYTEIVWTRVEGAHGAARSARLKPAADYRATVREFLAALPDADDDKKALLDLAETFFAVEGGP